MSKKDSIIILMKLNQAFGKDECCFSLDFYDEKDVTTPRFDVNNVNILYRRGVNFKGVDSIFVLCFSKRYEPCDRIKELLKEHNYTKIS